MHSSILVPITSLCVMLVMTLHGQVTTTGFQNSYQPEAPGTLLSHPVTNGSEPIGRTTTINYLNGWVIVGAEQPGSRPGSDWQLRVYDISNPTNLVRRLPSDFNLEYENDSWIYGNHGWNAHGTAQYENLLLPDPIRVSGFGGLVERAGENGVPLASQLPYIYNRSSQAGPWNATLLWYDNRDQEITISKQYLNAYGFVESRTLATIDHVGPYGGGEWHPMFFGDLLIMARSGGSGNDGIVVYRLQYENMDDADPSNDSVTPLVVGTLTGGFQGYWPNLFSDGTGLYVIGSTTDILMAADITDATMPGGDGTLQTVASLPVPGFSNASYPTYQDQFGFIHNRKIDMSRLVSGDPDPVVLTLNELNPPRPAGAPALPAGSIVGVDTSQMSLPLGNLWLTGGYPVANHNQGLGVWVHQQEPDTTAPRVTFHIPQVNRTNYPRHAPLSFLVHEHPRHGGPRNGIDFTVRAVGEGDVLGDFVPGFLVHDFSGNMTFTPDTPLAADTTYQVDFLSDPENEIGFRDTAGNSIEPYSYRFSTGGGIDADPPPSITAVTPSNACPEPNEEITIQIAASGTTSLEYRFNFDGTWSDWTSSSSAPHTYTEVGRPRVLVQCRDTNGQLANGSVKLLVIEALPVGPRPTQSSTLAIGEDEPGERRLWVVNTDAHTVSVLDAESGAKLAEHPVGQSPRGIARDSNGRYWITCSESDEIRVLNADGSTHATIPLEYGSAPFGIAASPDGQWLCVSLQGSGHLHRYLASTPLAAPITAVTVPSPRAIAISADGARVLVTRFLSADLQAQVAEHQGGTLAHVRTIPLAVSISWDSGDRAAGTPNYLSGIAISPDGSRAAVVSKQDNVHRGVRFGTGDLTHETTVRSVISFLDLTTNAEINNLRRDFDNSDSPSAVIWSPRGDTLFIALQGNNRVVAMDALGLAPIPGDNAALSTLTSPALITVDLASGLAPQGLLLDPVSQRLFTQDFMGRSVTVRQAEPFLTGNITSFPLLTTTSTVATETLPPEILLGKQVFYNASDTRMSADGYISCASCHIDGGHDGRAWDFTGRGEGLRRTTDLRGRSGIGHGNVHWSGNFDEIQDFEHDIRGPFGGTGFLPLNQQDFAALHPSPASGKSGLSTELDALSAYVTSLGPAHTPRSPHRSAEGALTTDGLAGRAVFESLSCNTCHAGDALTQSSRSDIATQVLTDVGTHSQLSGQRLGSALTGIDVPTLHGLHATATYLHHGEAKSLTEVFSYTGGTLLLATHAESIPSPGNPASISGLQGWQFNPAQGGGGFTRGMIGGDTVNLHYTPGSETQARVRFANVNGGTGGAARIAVRYLRQYGISNATLRVNDSEHALTLLIQSPDFGWNMGGWRWVVADVNLNAGNNNVVEVVVGTPEDQEFSLNAILVSNADVLQAAQPHRQVLGLPSADRDHLIAYLRQLDGRNDAGSPWPAPAPPAPQSPRIVTAPQNTTAAIGNSLRLHVVAAGDGPFTYVWRHGTTIIGSNSPFLDLSNLDPSNEGAYTVQIMNAQGEVTSSEFEITVNDALVITTDSLPAGTIGNNYHTSILAEGGVDARSWSLASGILPPGLMLDPETGEISGIPTIPARADFVIRVSDSSGEDTQAYTLDIAPAGGLDPDPDLILHYRFDESDGQQVWDSSTAGNNHLTTVPTAEWIADGRFGGAYGPAASDAEFPSFVPANQSDLDFNPRANEFTISTWVRTTATSNYHILFGKDGDDPYRIQYRAWTTAPGSNLSAINGNQYGGNLATNPPIHDGQWHLVTLVNFHDNGTWRTRLYYDDGSTFTQFDTGNGGTVSQLMRIGAMSAGWNPWNGQLDDFRVYRRALSQQEIATLHDPPDPSPTVLITPAPGQESTFTRPYAEFDITFSRPVSTPMLEHFTIAGTAGLTASHLYVVTENEHYRLRVAGFSNSGTITLQLPAGAVHALDDGWGNGQSNLASLTYTDPSENAAFHALSDEFEDASTLSQWQRNYLTEGWTGADKLETWDIDTSAQGHMRLMPYASSWYEDYTGALAYKEITGDFVLTLEVEAARRNGQPGRPTSLYSLAGIMIRTPRAFNNAAPVPNADFTTVLPWPPDGSYTTPWLPDTENYIFLSYGYADSGLWGDVGGGTWYNEIKTTINGNSDLYAVQTGIPAGESTATLQAVRIGQTFLLLRRHGAGQPWIIENRFVRNDMPATVQVGITTYTDWNTVQAMNPFHHNRTVHDGGNPDLVADVDYYRVRRPSPALTEAMLLAAPITGQGGALQSLTGSNVENYLGDHANTPAHTTPITRFEDWLRAHLTPEQLVQPALTDPNADLLGNGTSNLMRFALGHDEIQPLSTNIVGPPASTVLQLQFDRDDSIEGATLLLDESTTLDADDWVEVATSVDGAAFEATPGSNADIQESDGQVTIDFPMTAAPRFFRLRVLPNP